MFESESGEEGNASGLVSLVEPNLPPPQTPPGQPPPNQPPPNPPMHQPMPPYHPPPIGLPYTVAPYGFTVQAIPPHFQLATRHLIPPNQIYHLPPPTFQYPPHASNQQPPSIQYYGVRPAAGMPHVFPIATTMQPATAIQVCY